MIDFGHGDVAGQALIELIADEVGLEHRHQVVFGHALRLGDLGEVVAFERARRSLQPGVLADHAADRVGRQAEAHRVGGVVERGLGDHLAQHLAGHTNLRRLLGGDVAAELLAELAQIVVVAALELGAGEADAADLGDVVGAVAAEHIGDAPDAEADHQEQHHDLDDPAGRQFA